MSESSQCPVCDRHMEPGVHRCPQCDWELEGDYVLGRLTAEEEAMHQKQLGLARRWWQERHRREAAEQELTAMKARLECLQQRPVHSLLEITVSNPHYEHDLRMLDGIWDLARVLSPETVLIVTGCEVAPELLDRPVAERFRDEIDRRGDIRRGRRGLIIGDLWWWRETTLHAHPAIAIGGPSVNSLTAELASTGDRWESNGLCSSFVNEGSPRVALWGELAADVRASVEQYTRDPEGLSRYLQLCWR